MSVNPPIPVSYTHLDVYKRQSLCFSTCFTWKEWHRSSTIHSMDRIMNIKDYLQQHPQWKKRIHGFVRHPVKTRPYWWIRVWQPFYIKKGRGSVIYSSVRKDLPPFHLFQMGKYSVVEDFSCLNNAVGDIVIGGVQNLLLRGSGNSFHHVGSVPSADNFHSHGLR